MSAWPEAISAGTAVAARIAAMPRKRALDLSLLLLLVAALTAACAGNSPINVGPPGGDDDDDAFDGTFSNGAFPALAQEDCGSGATCHTAANQAGTGGLQLPNAALTLTTAAAFAEISAEGVVTTASPATSLLLTKGLGTGHGGLQQWDTSDATYNAVLEWIQGGALNN